MARIKLFAHLVVAPTKDITKEPIMQGVPTEGLSAHGASPKVQSPAEGQGKSIPNAHVNLKRFVLASQIAKILDLSCLHIATRPRRAEWLWAVTAPGAAAR